MYEIAHTLGQPLSVVLEMTSDEFTHWFTFLRIKFADKGSKHGRQRNNLKHPRQKPHKASV